MEVENERNENGFKVIFIGDASVGKTSIINKYVKNEFKDKNQSTIGADIFYKEVELDKEKVNLTIWDTSGQERYNSLISSYFRGSRGCFIVYDISDINSFNNLEKKFQLVKDYANEDVIIILVGNKSDLEEKRKVKTEEGKKFAEGKSCLFFETSAKNNENLDEIFKLMSKKIYESFGNSYKSKEIKKVTLNEHSSENIDNEKKGCCS